MHKGKWKVNTDIEKKSDKDSLLCPNDKMSQLQIRDEEFYRVTDFRPPHVVTVFVDQDLGTGVDEKRDAGDPSLEWNKGALFAEMHVYISSYKAALGSKKKLSKNKAKQTTIFKGPESIQ